MKIIKISKTYYCLTHGFQADKFVFSHSIAQPFQKPSYIINLDLV